MLVQALKKMHISTANLLQTSQLKNCSLANAYKDADKGGANSAITTMFIY